MEGFYWMLYYFVKLVVLLVVFAWLVSMAWSMRRKQ